MPRTTNPPRNFLFFFFSSAIPGSDLNCDSLINIVHQSPPTPQGTHTSPIYPTVDARTIAFDGAANKVAPRLAPTKEILSFRAYAARRRLNHLRRASCRLFQSEAVVRVVCRLELEVEQRRLAVRTDRMIHADIGEQCFISEKNFNLGICYPK